MDIGVSIITPTYQEIENLPALIEQLEQLSNQLGPYELIIVDDDSQDGTKKYIRSLNRPHIKLISRKNERNLSTAVIEGFQNAQYPFLICMDADLSHPVDVIPQMLKVMMSTSADFVVGSRLIKGGSVYQQWSIFRRINAFLARLPAKLFTTIHDPLSGFFCIRKETFEQADTLNPLGYKIGLELIVKCYCQKIKEIPIQFKPRYKGKSKLNIKEIINYLRHIIRLIKYKSSNHAKTK